MHVGAIQGAPQCRADRPLGHLAEKGEREEHAGLCGIDIGGDLVEPAIGIAVRGESDLGVDAVEAKINPAGGTWRIAEILGAFGSEIALEGGEIILDRLVAVDGEAVVRLYIEPAPAEIGRTVE